MDNHNELPERRARVVSLLADERIGAFLVTALSNIRYLSGFTGSNAALLITPDRALLFTDPRYQAQAPRESDCEAKIATGPLTKELAKWMPRLHVKSVGFEANRIGYHDYEQLRAPKGVRLKPVYAAIEQFRMVKSPAEIAAIKAAVQLNSTALAQALRHFKHSATEIDVAAEIEYRMRRLGADGPAFETIVASGERTALPHARPTNRRIQNDQLLLVDMGAALAGYASDMTRTHAVGRLSAKARRMYRAVFESQLAAIDAVKPGVSCARVDQAARDVLRGYGMGEMFIHSTGHGLGLEIHEGPRLGRKERIKLEPGMAITVEPGVYEEGVGGVRIEDTIVVTAGGCEILTPTRKELIVL
ncbi:MAG: M24 family metallopeptidase [Bryobacteraceae bacterium]